jgi:hypothetical protein
MTEAQASFDDLKRRLSTSPIMVTPHLKEPILLYIDATNQVVSSALIIEHVEEGKLTGCSAQSITSVRCSRQQNSGIYPHFQKLAYAVYMTGNKLPHYLE